MAKRGDQADWVGGGGLRNLRTQLRSSRLLSISWRALAEGERVLAEILAGPVEARDRSGGWGGEFVADTRPPVTGATSVRPGHRCILGGPCDPEAQYGQYGYPDHVLADSRRSNLARRG